MPPWTGPPLWLALGSDYSERVKGRVKLKAWMQGVQPKLVMQRQKAEEEEEEEGNLKRVSTAVEWVRHMICGRAGGQ